MALSVRSNGGRPAATVRLVVLLGLVAVFTGCQSSPISDRTANPTAAGVSAAPPPATAATAVATSDELGQIIPTARVAPVTQPVSIEQPPAASIGDGAMALELPFADRDFFEDSPATGNEHPTRFSPNALRLAQYVTNARAADETPLTLAPPAGVAAADRDTAGDDRAAGNVAANDDVAGDDVEPLPRPAGDPITLHLDNVDVRRALEMLSRDYGLNILIAPGVTGTVTANLEEVDQTTALLAILKLCNLIAHYDGDMIYVYSPSELPLEGTTLRVFPLDYASADDTLESIHGLLSPAGKAYVTVSSSETDNRKSQETIVVVDESAHLRRIENLISQIDHPPPQVMIEAHILAVELDKTSRHGVNYNQLFRILNKDVELNMSGFVDETLSPAVTARFWGNDVDLLLDCIKATTDAKTLASPRVMVINEQKAKIQIGEQLGYKVVTVTETAAVENVEFLELGVVLEVTPRITRDRRVLMRVRPEVSSGEINPETLLPEEETTELVTDVFLHNGHRRRSKPRAQSALAGRHLPIGLAVP